MGRRGTLLSGIALATLVSTNWVGAYTVYRANLGFRLRHTSHRIACTPPYLRLHDWVDFRGKAQLSHQGCHHGRGAPRSFCERRICWAKRVVALTWVINGSANIRVVILARHSEH